MVIVVCDLGLGIPSTVQRKGWIEEIRGKIQNDDGSLIHATIEHARSRTQHAHRGKGHGQTSSGRRPAGFLWAREKNTTLVVDSVNNLSCNHTQRSPTRFAAKPWHSGGSEK